MPLNCFFLPLGALAGHVSPHVSNTPTPPAGGSIWAADVPGWITAIGHRSLLIGAVITARYAIKAFRKQSEEVAILAEQNEREAAERRRDQASRIYLAAPRESRLLVSPSAVNGSDLPIHDAQIWYADPGSLSGPEDLGMIMPKEAPSSRRTLAPQATRASTAGSSPELRKTQEGKGFRDPRTGLTRNPAPAEGSRARQQPRRP